MADEPDNGGEPTDRSPATARGGPPPQGPAAGGTVSPIRGGVREVERLFATAAHELKTPVTTVVGLIQLLHHDRGGLTDADRAAAWDALVRQGQRLLGLVDDLLDLARLDPAHVTDVTVVLVAQAVADALEAAPAPDHATVVVDIPPAAAGLAVYAERVGVSRVLVNLLTNAYRYGGPTITIRAREDGTSVALTVSDDGPGVPLATASTPFDHFIRSADSSGQRGLGMGLAIAQTIVESFQGELSYQPGVPTGSEFSISLPMAPPAAPDAVRAIRPPP